MSETGATPSDAGERREAGGAAYGRAAAPAGLAPAFPLPAGVELVELARVREQARERWNFLPLTEVNGVKVSLSVIEGEYFAHFHDVDDEFYLVLEGRLLIELETGTVELGPGQGVRVPAGARHKAVAPEPTVALNVKSFVGGTVKCES